MQSAVARAQSAAQRIAPVAFAVERYEERDPHPGGQEAFVVRVQFPWHRQPMVPVKIEVTHDEPVILPAPHCAIRHGYEESLEAEIRTYSLEEICAEKLRSTQQTLARLQQRGWTRSRARDYYDLWRLVCEPDGRIDWDRVSTVLPSKCSLRDVVIASADDVFDGRLLDDARRTWTRTLGPFVPELPDVETVIAELRDHLAGLLRF